MYDLWFTVYIPYAKELGLITETIQIDKNAVKNYPKKHADNMIRTSPPTLYHQCQNVLLESAYCKTAKRGRLRLVFIISAIDVILAISTHESGGTFYQGTKNGYDDMLL